MLTPAIYCHFQTKDENTAKQDIFSLTTWNLPLQKPYLEILLLAENKATGPELSNFFFSASAIEKYAPNLHRREFPATRNEAQQHFTQSFVTCMHRLPFYNYMLLFLFLFELHSSCRVNFVSKCLNPLCTSQFSCSNPARKILIPICNAIDFYDSFRRTGILILHFRLKIDVILPNWHVYMNDVIS